MSAAFWQAIASGAIRLKPSEDRRVWEMRALGHGFDAIAAEIQRRRAKRSAHSRALATRRHAIRWREEYRREKRA